MYEELRKALRESVAGNHYPKPALLLNAADAIEALNAINAGIFERMEKMVVIIEKYEKEVVPAYDKLLALNDDRLVRATVGRDAAVADLSLLADCRTCKHGCSMQTTPVGCSSGACKFYLWRGGALNGEE